MRYLVKYVSKIEPTFKVSVKQNKTDVDKYFTRLIGVPEVATTFAIFKLLAVPGKCLSWIPILLKKGGS